MKVSIVYLLLLAACGAPDRVFEDPAALGFPDTSDPILAAPAVEGLPDFIQKPLDVEKTTRPGGYGSQGYRTPADTGAHPGYDCVLPWNEGICYGAKRKDYRLKFYASSCSSWWQARVVEAQAQLNAAYEASTGFGVYNVTFDGTFEIDLHCAAVPDGYNAYTQLKNFTITTVPGFGTFNQYAKASTFIGASAIESSPGWINGTDAQRQRFARNVIKHEMVHGFYGLGHALNPVEGNNVLMNAFGQRNSATQFPWTTDLGVTALEKTWMTSFVP